MTFRIDSIYFRELPAQSWHINIKGYQGKGIYCTVAGICGLKGLYVLGPLGLIDNSSELIDPDFLAHPDTPKEEVHRLACEALERAGWGPEFLDPPEYRDTIFLSHAGADALFKAMENPPKATEKALRAAKRYRETVVMRRVVSVSATRNYTLSVVFDDGKSGEVCIADRLFGPMFESLKDPELFAQVCVDEFGAICWPNGADLAPDALYAEIGSGE